MVDILTTVGSFIAGLFALEIPGVGISFATFALASIMLTLVARACIDMFFGGGD